MSAIKLNALVAECELLLPRALAFSSKLETFLRLVLSPKIKTFLAILRRFRFLLCSGIFSSRPSTDRVWEKKRKTEKNESKGESSRTGSKSRHGRGKKKSLILVVLLTLMRKEPIVSPKSWVGAARLSGWTPWAVQTIPFHWPHRSKLILQAFSEAKEAKKGKLISRKSLNWRRKALKCENQFDLKFGSCYSLARASRIFPCGSDRLFFPFRPIDFHQKLFYYSFRSEGTKSAFARVEENCTIR